MGFEMLRRSNQEESRFQEGILFRAKAIETEALAKAEKNAASGAGMLPLAFEEVCFRLAIAERQISELLARRETDILRDALPELVEIQATLLRLEAGRYAESHHLDPEAPLYDLKHETLVAQYLSLRAATAEIALFNRRNGSN
jgi:hypothetical protein